MSDHIGGEPTAEDRVIYDPEVSPMIYKALRALEELPEGAAEYQRRGVLERLVWAVVRWERGE